MGDLYLSTFSRADTPEPDLQAATTFALGDTASKLTCGYVAGIKLWAAEAIIDAFLAGAEYARAKHRSAERR